MFMTVVSLTGARAQQQQQDADGEQEPHRHHCLVGIGRLQVTSTPNCSDLTGPNNATEFISRHAIDGKFTFVDQRSVFIHVRPRKHEYEIMIV